MQEENLIALLRETMKFYAEPANYVNGQIEKDAGHLARFALDQVKKVEDTMNKLEQQFDELQNKVDQKTPEDIQKIVNDLINGR